MNPAKVKVELTRELGVFDVTWETLQGSTVSEIVFVVTDEDYATKIGGFLGYILEQNENGGKVHWKECPEKYQFDYQAYRFTNNEKLYAAPIRNEEVIKTIGATKYSILKRKMNAVKELYNAETDLQRLLQEIKSNSPTKTSETVLAAQNSTNQKDSSEYLKLPVSWEKKLADNNDQVKLLAKDLLVSIAHEFYDLTAHSSGDDLEICRGPIGLSNGFAVLMLRRDGVTIRLRANMRTLNDPQKWIGEKTYKWYFTDGKGEEKEIKITEKEQIAYAVELLKHSYTLAK